MRPENIPLWWQRFILAKINKCGVDMAFFENIDGKSGEQLSSSVLRHLLIRSPGLRTAFIDLVSKKSVKRPITIDDQFACFLEQWTRAEDDPDYGRPNGRIDMVIETDDAVVGIENKLNASFQDGQPAKYVADMERRAKDLTKLRDKEFVHLVVVIAPESRGTEIDAHIHESGLGDSCSFIAWQYVLEIFMNQRTRLDPGDSYILGEFDEFIRNSIGFPSYMQRAIPQLRQHWEPRGGKLHRTMRDSLWNIVPEELRVMSRPGFGLDYTGYYLSPNSVENSTANWFWCGFVNGEAVVDDGFDDKSFYMLATPFRLAYEGPQESNSPLRRSERVNGWTEHGHDCWILRIDDAWDSPEKWEHPLRSYFASVLESFGISENLSSTEAT